MQLQKFFNANNFKELFVVFCSINYKIIIFLTYKLSKLLFKIYNLILKNDVITYI